MTDTPNTYKKAPPRKKSPAKRVALSDEAKRAYEEMMTKRDTDDREYRTHLDAGNKGR